MIADWTFQRLSLGHTVPYKVFCEGNEDFFFAGPVVESEHSTLHDLRTYYGDPPEIDGHPFIVCGTYRKTVSRAIAHTFPSAIFAGDWVFFNDADFVLIKLAAQ